MSAKIGGGDTPIVIVKKQKGHGDGHHGGAWKVAYADFVTAMMAFFLVMWIVGLSQPVRQAIASYFQNPSGFMKSAQGGKSPLSQGSAPPVAGKPTPIFPSSGHHKTRIEETQAFNAVRAAIMRELQYSRDFRSISENVEIRLTSEGLLIELLETHDSIFFDTGSAHLKPRSERLMNLIAKQLRGMDNPVIVEGHTDSRPYSGNSAYTNWELSTDRANAARRALCSRGLLPGQIAAVRGFADRKLRTPKDPFNASNRRVSILVATKEETDDRKEEKTSAGGTPAAGKAGRAEDGSHPAGH